jgi:hypothetical protein
MQQNNHLILAYLASGLLFLLYHFSSSIIDIDVDDIIINQNHLSLRQALSFADPKTVTPRLPISMASLARTCAAPVEIPGEYYKSQDKEDDKIMQWFGALCGGTYIKLGGLDGMRFSNSYVFNKVLGWKGVLIELKEDNYKKNGCESPRRNCDNKRWSVQPDQNIARSHYWR